VALLVEAGAGFVVTNGFSYERIINISFPNPPAMSLRFRYRGGIRR